MPCEIEKVSSTIQPVCDVALNSKYSRDFSDPRLGHRGDDLSVSLARQFGGVLHRLHLALAADELGQPAPDSALQPRAQRPEAGTS